MKVSTSVNPRPSNSLRRRSIATICPPTLIARRNAINRWLTGRWRIGRGMGRADVNITSEEPPMTSRTTPRVVLLALVALIAVRVVSRPLVHAQASAAGPVDFVAHDIDASFRGGYSVSVADFNKDGKPDVIANSLAVS